MTLAHLARLLLRPDCRHLLDQGATVIEAQAALILKQHAHIQMLQLEHHRDMRGLICGWLISIDQPEVDIRDDLAELDRELGHRIAALEEHVV